QCVAAPKAAVRMTMAALLLIADDDPIQRRLLEATARRFGYDAETVDSGERALARLEASDRPPINLLILDLVMPDLDGMGVLARMRQRDIAVPAIVRTAHAPSKPASPPCARARAILSSSRSGPSAFRYRSAMRYASTRSRTNCAGPRGATPASSASAT